MRTAASLALLLAGCAVDAPGQQAGTAYPDATWAALTVWKEHHGLPSPRCYEHAYRVMVWELEEARFHRECLQHPDSEETGCAFWRGNAWSTAGVRKEKRLAIVLEESGSEVHEILHHLSGCVLKDMDPDHLGEVWETR